MRLRHEPLGPWTRAHEKFAKAWGDLVACGAARSGSLERWMFVRWGVRRIRHLTPAQARHGCRQLNAWRGGCQGYVPWAPLIEQRVHRRNRRRAAQVRAACTTASFYSPNELRARWGLKKFAPVGLVPSESQGKS